MSLLSSQALSNSHFVSSPSSIISFSERESYLGSYRRDFTSDVFPGYESTSIDEEFSALPSGVQQKYLSTLERLRFAQDSRAQEPTTWHTYGYSRQDSQTSHPRIASIAPSTTKPDNPLLALTCHSKPEFSLAERRGVHVAHLKSQRSPSQSTCQQKPSPLILTSTLSPQPSLLETVNTIPRKGSERPRISNKHRKTLLDASGIVVQKDSSICVNPSFHTIENPLSSLTDRPVNYNQASGIDIDVWRGAGDKVSSSGNASTMYDPFLWIDDERNINLDLGFDDYYVNADKVLASPVNKQISNLLLHRSAHTNENGFSDTASTSSLLSPKYKYFSHKTPHKECRSPTKSLASARTMNKKSSSSLLEPSAAGSWSPKSNEIFVDNSVKAFSQNSKLMSAPEDTLDSPKSYLPMKFDDIESMLFTDDFSALSDKFPFGDDELILSPCTDVPPQRYECSSTSASAKPTRIQHEVTHTTVTKPIFLKKIDSPLPSGNKEMTLRMTLTRPDLRLDEAKIYAWQDSKYPFQKHSLSHSLEDTNLDFSSKGPLGGPDGWEPEEKDRGVVKRLWNKVTHSRKVP